MAEETRDQLKMEVVMELENIGAPLAYVDADDSWKSIDELIDRTILRLEDLRPPKHLVEERSA